MNLNICHVGPKEWFDFKSDILFGLYHSLCSLNHDVTLSNNYLDDTRLNILVGSDYVVTSGLVEHILNKNIDYVIYEVEQVSENNINFRSKSGDLAIDFEIYLELVKGARFTITPYLHNVVKLKELGVEVFYSKWGFFEENKNNNISRSTGSFLYDFVFFGLVKGDRKDVLQHLSTYSTHSLISIDHQQPMFLRDYYLQKSRFCLTLRHSKEQAIVNPFRIFSCASNLIPVISNEADDLDGYLNYTTDISKALNLKSSEDLFLEAFSTTKNALETSLAKNLLNYF